MAYLKFNKDELVNLEYSLKREVLATNRGESCVAVEPGRDGHPAWT